MPTVQEILKQTGLSDEQIAALDAKAITAFTGVLTTAEQERKAAAEAAAKAAEERQAAAESVTKAEQERKAAAEALEAQEVRKRSNDEFYAESIVPALNSWGNEKAQKDAELAFYRTQLEGAKAIGFIPAEAPGFHPAEGGGTSAAPQRDAQGRYVAGAPGGTPGSPTFTMEAIDQRLGNGISNIGWAMQEYQRLSGGQFLPDSFDRLAEEADSSRLPFRDYVARKYDFAGKQAELQRKAAEEHDAKIRQEASAPFEAKLKEAEAARQRAIEETDRKWAEKIGSNPDVHIAQPSRFADVARAVKANERPDPLNLNEQQRKLATKQAIHGEIAERTQEVAA
jgi:hypothetical protein